jgi:hypothetical protein
VRGDPMRGFRGDAIFRFKKLSVVFCKPLQHCADSGTKHEKDTLTFFTSSSPACTSFSETDAKMERSSVIVL